MVNGAHHRMNRIETAHVAGLDRRIGSCFATIDSEIGHYDANRQEHCCYKVAGEGPAIRWARHEEGNRHPTRDEWLTAQYNKWVDRFGVEEVDRVLRAVAAEGEQEAAPQ